MIVVQFYCSAAWSNFLSTTDWRDCPFPIRCSWLHSQIFLLYLYDFILDSLFCSTGLCVYFYSRTILLLLICGVFLNQEVWISNFVLPQNYFGYSGSFVIHIDLGLLFLFLWRIPLEFERGGTETLKCWPISINLFSIFKSMTILTILILSINKHQMSFYLFLPVISFNKTMYFSLNRYFS